jgi:AcrR family transcriptional regulator
MPAAQGRGRILAAARTLFAEQGFGRTSTAQIAAAAQVPHGLIFYHFKTKMDLLLAVIRDEAVTALDGLLPDPEPGASLQQAVADLWLALTAVLGRPSPVRRVVVQEMAAHPEVRQRARELHEAITGCVSQYLAWVSGYPGEPGPEHDAAARLLTIAASVAPLLDEPGQPVVPPDALAAVIARGLDPAEPLTPDAADAAGADATVGKRG